MEVFCDQCERNIGKREFAWYSNEERDVDFCSENCYDLYFWDMEGFCDQCRKTIKGVKSLWSSDKRKDLGFCSEKCHKQYYNCDGEIISYENIKEGSKIQFIVKGIEKDDNFSNGNDVWKVTIDDNKKIKFGNGTFDWIKFFSNIYSFEEGNNWLTGTDSFYFFAHYLNRVVEIRFGIRYDEVEAKDGEKYVVFSLSDGRNVPQDKPLILDIIKEEKKKWDNLGYDGAYVNIDNKPFVDAGVPNDFTKSIIDKDLEGWKIKQKEKTQEIIFKWKYLEAFRREVEKGNALFLVELKNLPSDDEIINFKPWKREIKAEEIEKDSFWTYASNWIDKPDKYPLRCYYHPTQLYLILKNDWDLTRIVPRGTYIGKIEYPENSGKHIDPLSVQRKKELEKLPQNLNVNNEEIKVKTESERKPERTKEIQPAGETRNILLMGRTGNGKSTLGNVLINKNNNFEEVFKESSSSVSVTKFISMEELKTELGITYRIIDTIGLGDTNLKDQDVLYLLAKIATDEEIKKHGLNQVLFVAGGRFTKEEIETYNLLRSIIFDSEVDKFTTIVKTRFEDFENEDACEEDRQVLRNSDNSELASFVRRVKKILYVDNPQINISGNSSRVKQQNELNKGTREESRKRLLTYLATCQETYRSDSLVNIEERVKDYMPEEEKLHKQIEELEEKVKREKEAQEAQLEQKLAEIQDEHSQRLAIIKQEHADNQERLEQEQARMEKERKEAKEKWEREEARLDDLLNWVNEPEAQKAREDIEKRKQLMAKMVQCYQQ